VLDNFNRATAGTLGANWSQPTLLGLAAIAVFDITSGNIATGVAQDLLLAGNAYWNGTGSVFTSRQAAAFTFASTPANNSALMLKATGATNGAGLQADFVRVLYTTAGGGTITIATTTNSGGAYTTAGTLTGFGNFANGDTVTAMVDQTGTVFVWKTTAANVTTAIGSATLPANALWTTGGGRIGMQLPGGTTRVDNFAGGIVP
jgi:hypothetical protein